LSGKGQAVDEELVGALVQLYRRLATELPADIEQALEAAGDVEAAGSPGRLALEAISEDIRIARRERVPLCQDTGLPVFFLQVPGGTDLGQLREAVTRATRQAVVEVPLRSNAVDPLTGRNPGDGVGPGIPVLHFEPSPDGRLHVDLLLKGGGSENIGRLYSLPDGKTGAGRDAAGIRTVVLDAVVKAQGLGCPPVIVAVGVAGSRDEAITLAKRQLLRPLADRSGNPELAVLEGELLQAVNRLGIGPAGLGGRTTALGVKVGAAYRHPASFFVDVSFCCWACRRGRLDWPPGPAEAGRRRAGTKSAERKVAR